MKQFGIEITTLPNEAREYKSKQVMINNDLRFETFKFKTLNEKPGKVQ